jgi:hypothetical protein
MKTINYFLIPIIIIIFGSSAVFAQMIVPETGNNNYTTCSGILYDAGGLAGDYSSSSDGYTVICPGTAVSAIQLTGTYTTESSE